MFLSAYSARRPALAGFGTTLIGEILRPFQSLYQTSGSKAVGFWDSYIALLDVRSENENLQERLITLESRNSELLEVQSENERLRELLNIKKEHALTGITARVIGYNPTNWSQVITINQGSQSGVKVGSAVVNGAGVVGQVISVGPHSAQILAITDHASGIDAIVQGGRARGVIEGTGEQQCHWRFVLVQDEVKVGDRIITAGLDGIFPKGLLVGVVTQLNRERDGLFQEIVVKPAANLLRLEDVMVIEKTPQQLTIQPPNTPQSKKL